MATIEFVSHDYFPEDQYVKEIAILQIKGESRVAFCRKPAKNGGMFWSVASVSATRNGVKEFFPGYTQDSNFLERDIKDFLDRRSWEKSAQAKSIYDKPESSAQVEIQDGLPF